VTLIDHDKAKTVVVTGQLAMHLDERQFENGRPGRQLSRLTTAARLTTPSCRRR
jgi:hypothetical protein